MKKKRTTAHCEAGVKSQKKTNCAAIEQWQSLLLRKNLVNKNIPESNLFARLGVCRTEAPCDSETLRSRKATRG